MFKVSRLSALGRSFAGMLGGVALLMGSVAAQASMIYNVNRIIGVGTVQGTITTDGTMGILGNANIESWGITVTHPNLGAGSPSTISSVSGIGAGLIQGTGLSATATSLIFDFDAVLSYFYLYDGFSTYWCNVGGLGACGDSGLASAESVGWLISVDLAFEQSHRGAVTIASIANVPEPASLALAGLALAGLAGLRRRTS